MKEKERKSWFCKKYRRHFSTPIKYKVNILKMNVQCVFGFLWDWKDDKKPVIKKTTTNYNQTTFYM